MTEEERGKSTEKRNRNGRGKSETERKITEIERVAQRGRRGSQRALWEGTNPNNSTRIYIPARSWWNGPRAVGPRTQGRLVAIVEQWTHSSTIRFLSSFVFKLDLLLPPVVNGLPLDRLSVHNRSLNYVRLYLTPKHWREISMKFLARGNNEECRSRSKTRNMTNIGVSTEILSKNGRREMDRDKEHHVCTP